MLLDGRSLPPGARLDTEVCVIGAGPAGLVLAGELARAGHRVMVLEAGGAVAEERGRVLHDTMRSVGLSYPTPTSRRCAVEGSGPSWYVAVSHGGETLRLREFDRVDFEARPWLGLDAWPVTTDELRPYYQQARQRFGVPEALPDRWGAWDLELTDSPLADASSELETKPFDFGSREHFLEAHCRSVVRSAEVTVVTNAPVAELRSDTRPDTVDLAVCSPTDERSFTVEAQTFVLAAGGLENARLLLASHSRHTAGLGNGHDLVGRTFMEHPRCTAGVVAIGPCSPLRDAAVHDIHDHLGRPVQRKYALGREAAERHGAANHLFFFRSARWDPRLLAQLEGENLYARRAGVWQLKTAIRSRTWPDDPGDLARQVARSAGLPLRWVELQLRLRRGRTPTPVFHRHPILTLEVMAEQLPNPASRVRLATARDGRPIRRAELDWRVDADAWRELHRTTDRIARALSVSGDTTVHNLVPSDGSPPPRLTKADHHMGTTRMHPDPRHGVVDPDGRVHGVTNLHVAGSSVFPTAGGANPTLTIIALTLRLAEHLKWHELSDRRPRATA